MSSPFRVIGSRFRVLLLAVLSFSFTESVAQQVLLLPQGESTQLDHYLNSQLVWVTTGKNGNVSVEKTLFHTAVRPYLNADVHQRMRMGDADDPWGDALVMQRSARFSNRTIYTKRGVGFTEVDPQQKWCFGIQPVYEVSGGYDLKASQALLATTGGFRIGADYKQKIGLDLRLVAGSVMLPNYQDSLARHYGFVPGWGDRAYRLDSTRYGFQHFTGNITWRPTPVFNLQVGRDKHFWGDGHRSLFLGDQSAAFPYIKAQTTIWKLQYTSLFAWLQDWTNSTGSHRDFRNKFASMHYLSFNAAKWLSISIFEAVVWQGTDVHRQRWFDADYLNPMVFFRPVEYSVGSSDNAMLGLAGKIRFNRNNVLYGQLILDEFYLKEIKNWSAGWWANKQGVQAGYKCYNFGMIDHLYMQVEANVVRPYTYSHGSPQQSYSNGSLPLAHPMGANFAEVLGVLSYAHKGFAVGGELVGIRFGRDANATLNYGQDIFQSYMTRESDYGNKLFQGYATNIFLAKLTSSYRFNTKVPLRVQLTAIARSERMKVVDYRMKTSFVMVGLSMPLFRAQDDY